MFPLLFYEYINWNPRPPTLQVSALATELPAPLHSSPVIIEFPMGNPTQNLSIGPLYGHNNCQSTTSKGHTQWQWPLNWLKPDPPPLHHHHIRQVFYQLSYVDCYIWFIIWLYVNWDWQCENLKLPAQGDLWYHSLIGTHVWQIPHF